MISKLLLIYNKYAGASKSAKIIPDIKNYFHQKNIDIDLQFTSHKGHGIDLVKNADLKLYDGIIACGGDGTLFEVVNGYCLNEQDGNPPLGLIPNGTGNAFARELNLKSFEWQKAIDLILENKPKMVDIAKLNTENKSYYYINILGIGWPAEVGKTVEKIKFLGEVSYLLSVLYHIIFLKSVITEFEIDGKKFNRETIFVEIGNSRYTGSSFIISPNAIVDDGYLDVVIVNKCSRFRIMQLLPTIFSGKHIFKKEVEVIKAKKILIQTIPQKTLIPDGELLGLTPIEVECIPQKIPFFWR